MLADLVGRSRRASSSDAATERRVWESAFRALAVVVVHYRVIALVGADGSVVVQAVDPTEDASTAHTLLPRVTQLGAGSAAKGTETLGAPEHLGARSFLLYATPVPSGGAIVVASDAALLLRTVAWPQVPFGLLFVTDPAGVTWSGCETSGGCQLAAAHVVPAPAVLSTRAPVRINASQAAQLGLFPADAIWLSEKVGRPTGSWSVTWVASMQPITERERSALSRTVTTAVAAAIVVALVGVILLRQQHRTDQLASQLRYATAMAKAHELENQLVRARSAGHGRRDGDRDRPRDRNAPRRRAGTRRTGSAAAGERSPRRRGSARGHQAGRPHLVDHPAAARLFAPLAAREARGPSLETVVERTRELLAAEAGGTGLQLDVELDATTSPRSPPIPISFSRCWSTCCSTPATPPRAGDTSVDLGACRRRTRWS